MYKLADVYERFEEKLSDEERNELKKILSNKLSALSRQVKYMDDETIRLLDRYLDKIMSY